MHHLFYYFGFFFCLRIFCFVAMNLEIYLDRNWLQYFYVRFVVVQIVNGCVEFKWVCRNVVLQNLFAVGPIHLAFYLCEKCLWFFFCVIKIKSPDFCRKLFGLMRDISSPSVKKSFWVYEKFIIFYSNCTVKLEHLWCAPRTAYYVMRVLRRTV